MSLGITSRNQRIGQYDFALHYVNPANAVAIVAPTAPTLAVAQNSIIGVKDVSSLLDTGTRSVSVGFRGYNILGGITNTVLTPAVATQVVAVGEMLMVTIPSIPAWTLEVVIMVDDLAAQIFPTSPRTRRGIAGETLTVPVMYEPFSSNMTAGDYADLRDGTLITGRRSNLGLTTDAITHTIEFTKVEIPINGLPTDMITTRSSQMMSATFSGATSGFQALFSGGTSSTGDTLANVEAFTQLGFRSGTCDTNRYVEIIAPGNTCGSKQNGLLLCKAIHGEDSQEINYSSEEASNVPVTFKEAPSRYNLGLHTLTFVEG